MASELTTDELFFNDLVVNAELVSILVILKEVCHKAGITGPDGISIGDWFARQKKIELERLFGLLEEKDPDFAARLHERYCKARHC